MAIRIWAKASTKKTSEPMKDLKEWALPASIAFAGACVLGAGVLVSMPLNALKGIANSARLVVDDYRLDEGLKVELSNRYVDSFGETPFEVELKGGESVGRFAR